MDAMSAASSVEAGRRLSSDIAKRFKRDQAASVLLAYTAGFVRILYEMQYGSSGGKILPGGRFEPAPGITRISRRCPANQDQLPLCAFILMSSRAHPLADAVDCFNCALPSPALRSANQRMSCLQRPTHLRPQNQRSRQYSALSAATFLKCMTSWSTAISHPRLPRPTSRAAATLPR